MNKIGVFLAAGFEEIEALTPVDLLRRAGILVDMISITGAREVTGAHDIRVTADKLAEEAVYEQYDGLLLPGGMPGADNLLQSTIVNQQIKAFYEEQKLVAAICAAPIVLGALGILEGKRACCYPGYEDRLLGAEVVMDKVVVDHNVITGRGMGKSISFSLAVVEYLQDKAAADNLKKSILHGHQK